MRIIVSLKRQSIEIVCNSEVKRQYIEIFLLAGTGSLQLLLPAALQRNAMQGTVGLLSRTFIVFM